jgi:hypothetical protein
MECYVTRNRWPVISTTVSCREYDGLSMWLAWGRHKEYARKSLGKIQPRKLTGWEDKVETDVTRMSMELAQDHAETSGSADFLSVSMKGVASRPS